MGAVGEAARLVTRSGVTRPAIRSPASARWRQLSVGIGAAVALTSGCRAQGSGWCNENFSRLELQAAKHSAQAEALVGNKYRYGCGVARDTPTAISYYKRSIADGSVKALIYLANLFENGDSDSQYKNASEAMSLLEEAANLGDSDAAFSLAISYKYGAGGASRDERLAAKWMILASKNEHSGYLANAELGDMYYFGRGIPQNFTLAAHEYIKAANMNDGKSQLYLGIMYYKGEGVTQDYVQAHKWFNLAASLGRPEIDTGCMILKDADVKIDCADTHATALKYRDLVASHMTPAQIAQAQRLASERVQK